MAYASTTELASWMQDSSIETATATLALAVASSAIRTHCGWSIEEEDVDAVLDGTGERSLWVPTLKLTAVGSVVVDGDTLVAGTDYDWTSYGKLIRAGRWPNTPRSVTISYTHGYETLPEVVKGACLIAAAIMYRNPEFHSSRSETMGPFAESVGYPTTSPSSFGKTGLSGGLPAAVAEMLHPFKLEHVG